MTLLHAIGHDKPLYARLKPALPGQVVIFVTISEGAFSNVMRVPSDSVGWRARTLLLSREI